MVQLIKNLPAETQMGSLYQPRRVELGGTFKTEGAQKQNSVKQLSFN